MNLKKVALQSLLVVAILTPAVAGTIFELCYRQRIYPNIKIANIDFGGVRADKAANLIESLIFKRLSQNSRIRFVESGKVYSLDLDQASLIYKSQETVRRAFVFGRGDSFFVDWRNKLSLVSRQPNFLLDYEIDKPALDAFLATIAAELEREPVDPSLKVIKLGKNSLGIEVDRGNPGKKLNKEEVRNQIFLNLSSLDFSAINLQLEEQGDFPSDQTIAAVKQRAGILVNRKVILKVAEQIFTISGEEIVGWLNFSGGFSKAAGEESLSKIAKAIEREPQDALFQFENNRAVVFQPALEGIKLKAEESWLLIEKALADLENGLGQDSEIDLVIEITEPKIKTSDVNDLGIKELLGRGDSSFKGSISSRVHNIGVASKRINGLLIAPGETFSFNKTLGDVSQETGYKTAYIIKDGRTTLGDGGGVCQVSTTLFRAVLNAGLPVIERRAHSYRVSYYEQNSKAGFDATVFDPTADLKFKNDTEHHLLIQNYFDPQKYTLIFEIYGTADGREVEISNSRVWDITAPPDDLYIDDPTLKIGMIKQIDFKSWGAKAAFDWKVYRKGELINEETFYSVYKPWQAIFLKGTAP